MEKSRKEIVQEDIMNLLEKLSSERNTFRKIKLNDSNNFMQEGVSDKDYNTYRKLVHSLDALISTFRKTNLINNNDVFSENEYKQEGYFYSKIYIYLTDETNQIHTLMNDALERNSFDQYRCLNNIYLMLVNLVDDRISKDMLYLDKQYLSHLEYGSIEKVIFNKEYYNKNIVTDTITNYKTIEYSPFEFNDSVDKFKVIYKNEKIENAFNTKVSVTTDKCGYINQFVEAINDKITEGINDAMAKVENPYKVNVNVTMDNNKNEKADMCNQCADVINEIITKRTNDNIIKGVKSAVTNMMSDLKIPDLKIPDLKSNTKSM